MLQEVTEEDSRVITVRTVQILEEHKLRAVLLEMVEVHVE
jgi:hypothetical protein